MEKFNNNKKSYIEWQAFLRMKTVAFEALKLIISHTIDDVKAVVLWGNQFYLDFRQLLL